MASGAKSNIITIKKLVWNGLFVIVYPVITVFSLLFVGLLWLFSQLSFLLSKLGTDKTNFEEAPVPIWKHFESVETYRLQRLYVDEVLFGPTNYKLKAQPIISAIETAYFGEFYFKCFEGILLQRWNTSTFTEVPDFSLVFLDGLTGELTEVKRISSFTWKACFLNEQEVKISWYNGQMGGELIVSQETVRYVPIRIE